MQLRETFEQLQHLAAPATKNSSSPIQKVKQLFQESLYGGKLCFFTSIHHVLSISIENTEECAPTQVKWSWFLPHPAESVPVLRHLQCLELVVRTWSGPWKQQAMLLLLLFSYCCYCCFHIVAIVVLCCFHFHIVAIVVFILSLLLLLLFVVLFSFSYCCYCCFHAVAIVAIVFLF